MSEVNNKIIDFVNSGDIREHWRKIGYEPSALESAWLVWQSKNHTVEEKRAAWKEIIDKSEDCPIPNIGYAVPQPPLHEFLKRYIEIESNLISGFYKKDDDAAYSYRMYFDDGSRNWYNVSAMFKTFDEAYVDSWDEELPEPNFVEFTKTYFGAEGKQIFVRLNAAKEIVRVDETNYLANDEEYSVFQFGFQEMNFEFPLPFKKGDVLRKARGRYTRPHYSYDTYAFESIDNECGYTIAKGYAADENGDVQNVSIHMYMDLEHVSSPLVNGEKALLSIGKFLSGEIDLALLLGAYRDICCRSEANMLNLHAGYTKEKRKLAGVENES